VRARLGWDGVLVLGCSGLVLAGIAYKGVHGLEPWVVAALVANAAYVAFSWWSRT
jgi:hypothetical protein